MKNQKQLEYLKKVYFKETYGFINYELDLTAEQIEEYYEIVSNEMINFIWDYYKYLKFSPEEIRMVVNQQGSTKVYLNIIINVLESEDHKISIISHRQNLEHLFAVIESFTRKTLLLHLPGIDKDIVMNYLYNVKNLFRDSKHIDKFLENETMQEVCEHFLNGFIKKYFDELKGLKSLNETLGEQWDLKWK